MDVCRSWAYEKSKNVKRDDDIIINYNIWDLS